MRSDLRKKYRDLRKQLSNDLRNLKEMQICQFLSDFCLEAFQSDDVFIHQTIALYQAFDGEVRLDAFAQYAHQKGIRLVYPKIIKNQALVWYQAHSWSIHQFGILEPIGPQVDLFEIDLILAPLVAFDQSGHRLGMGGGYYDRTLSQKTWQGIFMGVAFDLQCVPVLDQEKWDYALDAIATESSIQWFSKKFQKS